MKKTCKILSGSLLVALMAFGLVKGNPVEKTGGLQVRDVLAEDVTKDVAGRIVRKADGEAPVATGKISEAKAQVSEEVEGKRHIRFVVGIDSYAYDGAHFDITFKNGEEVVKTWADQRVSYVYEAVEAAGETVTAADVFGEGYNYLIAFTVNNVPQANWDNTIEVNATVETAEQEYVGTVAEKSVQGIIDADDIKTYQEIKPLHAAGLNGGVVEVAFKQSDLPNGHLITENKVLVTLMVDGVASGSILDDYEGSAAGQTANYIKFLANYNFRSGRYIVEVLIDNLDGVNYKTTFTLVDGKYTTISSYQNDKNKALDEYCEEKGYLQILYTEENWTLINTIIAEGKANINKGTSLDEIDVAFANTCALIDAVDQRVVNKYIVSFYNGTEKIGEEEVIEGLTISEFPRISGKVIEGWYSTSTFDEGTNITLDTKINSNLNVYVKFVETEITLPEYEVICNAIGGVANCYTIKWNNSSDAIVLASTIDDCSVNVGSITNFEYFNVFSDQVVFNIHTGADANRTLKVIVHTKSGDFEMSFVVENGAFAGWDIKLA